MSSYSSSHMLWPRGAPSSSGPPLIVLDGVVGLACAPVHGLRVFSFEVSGNPFRKFQEVKKRFLKYTLSERDLQARCGRMITFDKNPSQHPLLARKPQFSAPAESTGRGPLWPLGTFVDRNDEIGSIEWKYRRLETRFCAVTGCPGRGQSVRCASLTAEKFFSLHNAVQIPRSSVPLFFVMNCSLS